MLSFSLTHILARSLAHSIAYRLLTHFLTQSLARPLDCSDSHRHLLPRSLDCLPLAHSYMIGDCTPLPPPVAWSLARSLRTLLPLPNHMFSCSLARSFVRFLIIMDSYTQSFARSLDCSIARSLAHILARSYTRSLTHILARSIAHRLLARSHTRSLIYSLARSYILARSIAHRSSLAHIHAHSYIRSLSD